MHILFVWPAINNSVATHLGIGSMSALLKHHGHKTSLLRIDRKISPSRFAQKVKDIAPDMVGFSIVTNQWLYAKKYAGAIKAKMDIPIVAGGIHVTTNPEQVIKEPSFDILCTGEGEYPLLDIVEALSKKEGVSSIKNISVRNNGNIVRNRPRPFVHDLDSLPFCDTEMFFPDPSRIENLEIMAGRGCPYGCTYCCEHVMRKIYKGIDNKFIRYRSEKNVIDEIAFHVEKKRLPIKRVIFQDDIFTIDKEWLSRFCTLYKKKFTIPFTCNGRVETLDEESLAILKEAGCDTLEIGVECGNEWLRTHVLKRKMTNQKIQEIFDLTKKIGIGTYAYYILGFPFETQDMLEETYQLHLHLNPDRGFQIATFYPFPKTELWDICKQQGLISEDERRDTFSTGNTVLNLPIKREISRMYKKFLLLWKTFAIPTDEEMKFRHPRIYPLYYFFGVILGKSRAYPLFSWMRKILRPALFIKVNGKEDHRDYR